MIGIRGLQRYSRNRLIALAQAGGGCREGYRMVRRRGQIGPLPTVYIVDFSEFK